MIFSSQRTLFFLSFFFGKKHKSRKQNNELTSEKNSLTEEIERALEDLQSSQEKTQKHFTKKGGHCPFFLPFSWPSWGDSGALVVGRGRGSFVEHTKIGRRNGSTFLTQY
jgi:hypothetical protein